MESHPRPPWPPSVVQPPCSSVSDFLLASFEDISNKYGCQTCGNWDGHKRSLAAMSEKYATPRGAKRQRHYFLTLFTSLIFRTISIYRAQGSFSFSCYVPQFSNNYHLIMTHRISTTLIAKSVIATNLRLRFYSDPRMTTNYLGRGDLTDSGCQNSITFRSVHHPNSTGRNTTLEKVPEWRRKERGPQPRKPK